MKLSDKLKARRAAISDEMRGLVDAAAAENRDLSADERPKFEALKADKDRLAKSIADAEASEDEDRSAEGRDVGTRELAEGEVRALRPEQRMADLVPRHEGPPLSMDLMFRGMLTGNWNGADAERRAAMEGTGSAGGFLVPASLSAAIIDLARNRAVVGQAGALTIPMETAELTIAKVLTDPVPQWRAESQPVTESAPTFGRHVARAMTLAVIVRMSIELYDDAPRVGQIMENAIAAALALELDRAALFGSGVKEPRGLYNADGINTVSMGTNGATPTDYDAVLDAILAIENANGSAVAAIMSPRTRRTLAGLKTGLSGDKTPLVPPAEFTALRRLVSNQVPVNLVQGTASTASASFIGDFSQMALCIRNGLTLETTRVGGDGTFSKLEVLVRGYIRADVAILRPSHFTRIVGIKA